MEIADAPNGLLLVQSFQLTPLALTLPYAFRIFADTSMITPPCSLAPSIFTAAELTRIYCASESTTHSSQACLRVRELGLICVSAAVHTGSDEE